MMQQNLESLGTNQIDNFSCATQGECPCRVLISEVIREIETLRNQQSYHSACLARSGFPMDEQSLKDYQNYSCCNHNNS